MKSYTFELNNFHDSCNFISYTRHIHRIKAAQKHQLNDSMLGMTALNRVTVEDVRNIWIHRIIADTGLPSYKVNITRNIVDSMENVLNKRLKKDDEGGVEFENFLPTMVFLIRWVTWNILLKIIKLKKII